MIKTIFDAGECSRLIPHWPELNPGKLARIVKMKTRISEFTPKTLVLSGPPILVTAEGFILNGKHRTSWAYMNGRALEACLVQDPHDIIHHAPRCTYGDLAVEAIIDTYENRGSLSILCQHQNAGTIRDLVETNRQLFERLGVQAGYFPYET